MADNPGLFFLGWSRPFSNEDFRQLRRHLLCWRVADLDKNGTPELEEGWRITGDGLEAAIDLDYKVILNGVGLKCVAGSVRRAIHRHLQTINNSKLSPAMNLREIQCALAPILVKFLRPESPILAADLNVYGPFKKGDVASIPFVHTIIYLQNGSVEIYTED